MNNTNPGMVLLACSVVVFSGALCLGLAGLIEAISPHRGLGYEDAVVTAGYALLAMGGISFLKTYFRKKE
jgi:hypothetical protein